MPSTDSLTFQQQAFEKIRLMLIRGEVRAGELLSRRSLAERLGISPNSVQQVLGRLEGVGLVERRPQSGTYLRQLSLEEIDQAHDLRELVEPYLARRAAQRATGAQLRELQRSCQRMADYAVRTRKSLGGSRFGGVLSNLLEQEHRFHGTIAAAAQNVQAAHVVENMGILLRIAILKASPTAQTFIHRSDVTAVEHQQIYDAIAAGDADLAEQRMRDHVSQGRLHWNPDSTFCES